MDSSSYQGGVAYEAMGDNFDHLSQTIASNIKKISQNVVSMAKMVTQLQTPQDSQELRNQLRNIQTYTQKLAKDTSGMLKELMNLPADKPNKKMTVDRLSEEYLGTLNAFQTTQRSAAQKSKDDVKKVKAQHFQIGDPFAVSNTGEGDVEAGAGATGLRRQEQLTAQSERELQELEERERDIRQLESDIVDVNQIFKELGSIVHEQGAVLESIESHVTCAAQNAENGLKELRLAVENKNKLRKRKVYLALVLIIIISIILIIIFHN